MLLKPRKVSVDQLLLLKGDRRLQGQLGPAQGARSAAPLVGNVAILKERQQPAAVPHEICPRHSGEGRGSWVLGAGLWW